VELGDVLAWLSEHGPLVIPRRGTAEPLGIYALFKPRSNNHLLFY
jgi:hypothetical protein